MVAYAYGSRTGDEHGMVVFGLCIGCDDYLVAPLWVHACCRCGQEYLTGYDGWPTLAWSPTKLERDNPGCLDDLRKRSPYGGIGA